MMQTATLTKSTDAIAKDFAMMLPDTVQIQKDLALVSVEPVDDVQAVDPELEKLADAFVAKVLSYDPSKADKIVAGEQCILAVNSMGERMQREAAALSNSPMLKTSIRQLASKGKDGGEVANTLLALNQQVLDLDPSGIDFSQVGAFKRALSHVPFVGNRVQRYFAKYQAADNIIAEILQALKNGQEQLRRDNGIMTEDKKRMLMMAVRLQQAIGLGMVLDTKLSAAMGQLAEDDPRRNFIGEELVFPLRQRIQDLQQQLAVNQQGAITFEIIIRTNRELIKGVGRAEMVTVTALNIAVAVALALANQECVLKALTITNATTNDLIKKNSQRLRQQVAKVHEQASSAFLDTKALQQSFMDIKATLDEISGFRMKALPMMSENITTLFQLGEDAQAAIEKMEKGNRTAPEITLDINTK